MQSNTILGIDVSGAELTVWSSASGKHFRVSNDSEVLEPWLDSLEAGTWLAFESSGRAHQRLLELACDRGFRVYLLDPRAVHHYAKALHRGHKSDPLDSEAIGRYVLNEHDRLRPYRPAEHSETQILMLQRRCAALTNSRKRIRQSMADVEEFAGDVAVALKHLETLIDKLKRRIARLVTQNPQRRELYELLRTMPGIGVANGCHHATLLARVDPRNANAYVAFGGMDLRLHESGKFKGQRKLTKAGPSETRRLIFMAARSATRTDPAWKQLYERYLARGLSTTQAHVALARKMLRIAYRIYRSREPYDPQVFAKNAGLVT